MVHVRRGRKGLGGSVTGFLLSVSCESSFLLQPVGGQNPVEPSVQRLSKEVNLLDSTCRVCCL